MTAMENSLRKALETGNADDPAFRESIYAASERALERMLAQKNTDEGSAHQQRARLAQTINRVEDEFYERQTAAGAAADGPAQHDPELSLDPAYTDAHAYSTHPAQAADVPLDERGGDFELVPVFDRDDNGKATAMAVGGTGEAGVALPIRPSPRAKAAATSRTGTLRNNTALRRFLVLALSIGLLLAVGAYVMSAFTGVGGDDVSANGGANWIDLFDGERLEAVATSNGGRVEAVDETVTGVRSAVRFTPAGEGGAIAVTVGPGVVSSLRGGGTALVELAAGSPDGKTRSFAVECRLEGASACGRQVFTTLRREETFVFDMNVPNGAVVGELAITPSASETGAADLFVYSVRIRDNGVPAA